MILYLLIGLGVGFYIGYWDCARKHEDPYYDPKANWYYHGK